MIFVLTFSYAHVYLDEAKTEAEFGLRVAINAVSDEKLRSVERSNIGVANRDFAQAVGQRDLRSFGFDDALDIIRKVSGRAADDEFAKMGIPFTPAIPGATIRRWKAPFIQFPEPIIPGPFKKWTNGSAPIPPVATMSGACGGRLDLCARERRGWWAVDHVAGPVPVSRLRVGNNFDGWHGVPGHTQAVAAVVSGDVVHHQPKERSQCARAPEGIGAW